MSTGYSTQPPTYPASGPQPGGFVAGAAVPDRSFWNMRGATIRSKLALILLVPLVAVLALAALRLVEVGNRARDAGRVEQLTKLSSDVSELTQRVHNERMAAAAYLASATPDASRYNAALRETDAGLQTYNAKARALVKPPAAVRGQLRRIDDETAGLPGVRRSTINRAGVAVSEAVQRYDDVIEELVGYSEVLSRSAGDGSVADDLRALSAFDHAVEAVTDQEATAYAAQIAGDLGDQQRTAIIATQARQQETLLDFAQIASPAQRALVDGAVTGSAVTAATQLATRLSRGERVDPAEITRAFDPLVQAMRGAERGLEQRTIADAVDARRAATRQAAIEVVILVLVLAVALVLAFVLARSLNRALRRLREGALAVANRDLPDAVARLRDVRNLGDGGANDIVRQVRDPIQLNNRDEIGQVAQAFNVVHREAVRIAAEQAALRTSVSTMFLNLARRSQSLVDRMIGELDQIERGEEDPKRLAQLFELDHLATRMRRNDENLLVLAGADSSAPRREDALLVDALRAAQSEVELYNRIEFGAVDTDISIAALAVNDVVRLLAELLDNATRFSPPHTIVVAEARRIRDYVLILIEDQGLGMSSEQMDVLNRRLAEPPVVDVGAFRLMGLAVVGRLANRYGIRVELRANLDGGTVAQVMLPSSVVVLPDRPIEGQIITERAPQLESGTYGVETGLYGGRFSTGATTLAAVAPEPWQVNAPQHPSLPLLPSQRRPVPSSPAPAGPGSAAPAGPGSPAPGGPGSPPAGPGSPAPAGPGSPAPGWPGSMPAWPGTMPAEPPVTSAPPAVPAEVAEPVQAEANGAIRFPTVAYPAMRAASPDLQVALGFVTPDGTRIGPRRRPTGPQPTDGADGGSPPPADRSGERSDAPIFLQMQANWFQGHDTIPEWSMPTAGHAPPPKPGSAGNGTSTGPGAGAAGAAGPAQAAGPQPGSAPGAAPIPAAGPAPAPAASPAPPPVRSPDPAPAASPPAPVRNPDRAPAWGAEPAARFTGPIPSTGAAPSTGPASFTGPAPYTGPAAARPAGPPPARPAGPAPARATSPGPTRNAGPAPVWATDPAGVADPAPVTPAPPRAPGGPNGRGAGAGGPVPDRGRPPAGPDNAGPRGPARPNGTDDDWRTVADDGWHRAMAASEPSDAGTTRSGLPKRVPQAQLVPGGVQTGPRNQNRRSPDEVRGLLSAYHRGVQRGRTESSAEAAADDPGPKENER